MFHINCGFIAGKKTSMEMMGIGGVFISDKIILMQSTDPFPVKKPVQKVKLSQAYLFCFHNKECSLLGVIF